MKNDIKNVCDTLHITPTKEQLTEIEEALEARKNDMYEDYNENVDVETLFDEDFADNVKSILENMGFKGISI